MAGIHSLPPELLIEIFVAAGSEGKLGPIRSLAYYQRISPPDSIESTGIYSLATASKQMYHAFKAHEHHIFTGIAHQLVHQLSDKSWKDDHYIPDFTLAVRFACLAGMVDLPNRPTDPDVFENLITRVKDMDVSDILKPSLYRGILDYLRSEEFVWLLEEISCLDKQCLGGCWLKHVPHGFLDNLPMAALWMIYRGEWGYSQDQAIQGIGQYDAVFRALFNRLVSYTMPVHRRRLLTYISFRRPMERLRTTVARLMTPPSKLGTTSIKRPGGDMIDVDRAQAGFGPVMWSIC